MTCKGIEREAYISQPGMVAIDHLINMGRMLLAAQRCKCQLCKSMLSPSELSTIAINVELTRRHNPVKVFQALVENWDAERIMIEFAERQV